MPVRSPVPSPVPVAVASDDPPNPVKPVPEGLNPRSWFWFVVIAPKPLPKPLPRKLFSPPVPGRIRAEAEEPAAEAVIKAVAEARRRWG